MPDAQNRIYQPVETLRKQLLSDQRTIEVSDLGSGSKVHRSSSRTVASIAQHSAKNALFGRLLNRLADEPPTTRILELGTSLGLSTAYLALSNNPVITIEGCPQTARVAKANFGQLGLNNIELFIGDFATTFPQVLRDYSDINFVFIDGNHSYAATIDYYRQLSQYLPDQSVIIFDDIYWSEGMTRAWKEIVVDNKNQVTIDLFHVGLVFFRKDQAKEHFRIRI